MPKIVILTRMAISATIHKVNLNLSNLNTHYYQDFDLVVARHPSENESRMMFRLLAFLYCAHEELEFTKGISTQEEPDIWHKDYCGEVLHWIELGLPDEKRIRQACGRSHKVSIFTYHHNKAQEWFAKIKDKFINNNKVHIHHFKVLGEIALEALTNKNMSLSCIIEDNQIHISNDDLRITIEVN
jgi:uncharacterized protein YaeQ